MRSDHRDPAARTLGAGANAPAPTAGSLPSGTAAPAVVPEAAMSWARLPAEGERGHLERPGEDQVEVVDAMGAG
jgi:hypothetical protein